ncbi:MAG: hypothetical protein ABIH88_01750 [Patescibacteria group bacterium]
MSSTSAEELGLKKWVVLDHILQDLQERENKLVLQGGSPSCSIDPNWFSEFGQVTSSHQKEDRFPILDKTKWYVVVTVERFLNSKVIICRAPGMSRRQNANKPRPPLILASDKANFFWIKQIVQRFIDKWTEILDN